MLRAKAIFAAVIACLLPGLCYAQCENGTCPATPVRSVVKAVGEGVVNTVQKVREVKPLRSLVVQTLGGDRCGYSVGSSSGVYQVGYGSTGVRSYGSSGGSGLGFDTDGAVIVSYGPIQSSSVSALAVAPMPEVDSLGIRQRKASRQVIVDACQQAHVDGTISLAQLQAIKLATRSPRMLERIEDLIIERAMSSGAYAFKLDQMGNVIKGQIDWEAIGDFILKIAPIIFKLIELFL